jgi:phosphatidylserine synthase 2
VELSNLLYLSLTFLRFFYKPITLSALGVALAALAYIATTNDVLEEGRDKRRVCEAAFPAALISPLIFLTSGVYASVGAFLVFSMLHARDGPFIRPHPAFWRVVLGINLLYELAMVFLLFQDLTSARRMMTQLDPSLNRPLADKSYAEDCDLNARNLYVRTFSHYS